VWAEAGPGMLAFGEFTMPPILRSILAVIAGFVAMSFVVIVLTLLSVKSMGLKGGHPTAGYLVINVVFSFLAAAAGGFVTALVAAVKPVEHAYVLACVMLVMGALSYARYRGTQPGWYQLMLVLVPPLCAIAGAAICARIARQHTA
jgi:hypothetical protein